MHTSSQVSNIVLELNIFSVFEITLEEEIKLFYHGLSHNIACIRGFKDVLVCYRPLITQFEFLRVGTLALGLD